MTDRLAVAQMKATRYRDQRGTTKVLLERSRVNVSVTILGEEKLLRRLARREIRIRYVFTCTRNT